MKILKSKLVISILGLHFFLIPPYLTFAEKNTYIKTFSGEVGEEKCSINFDFNDNKQNSDINENIRGLVLFYFFSKAPSLSKDSQKQFASLEPDTSNGFVYLKKGESLKIEKFLTENKVKNLKNVKNKEIDLEKLKKNYITLIQMKIDELKKENKTLNKNLNKDRDFYINFETEKIKKETNNTEDNLKEFLKDKNKLEKNGRKSVKLKIKENENSIKKYYIKINKIKKIKEKDFIYALNNLNFSFPVIKNKKDNFCLNINFDVDSFSKDIFSKNLYISYLKFILIKYMIQNKIIYDKSSDPYSLSLQCNLIYYNNNVDNIISFLDSKKNLEKIKKCLNSKSFNNFKKESFKKLYFNEYKDHLLANLDKSLRSLQKGKLNSSETHLLPRKKEIKEIKSTIDLLENIDFSKIDEISKDVKLKEINIYYKG